MNRRSARTTIVGAALVAVATAHFGQASTVRFNQLDPRLIRAVQKLAHPGIAPCRFKIDFNDGLGCRLETHAQGMEAEENFG